MHENDSPRSRSTDRIVVRFLVPVHDNEGVEFPREVFTRLEESLLTFGGFTELGRCVGLWRDPDSNRTFRDQQIAFEVGVPVHRLLEIDRILRNLGSALGQVAIWRVVVGIGGCIACEALSESSLVAASHRRALAHCADGVE